MDGNINIDEAIDIVNDFLKYGLYHNEKTKFYTGTAIKCILKELDMWRRIGTQNLKDSDEFKNEMCNHRCMLNNEVMELKDKVEELSIDCRNKDIIIRDIALMLSAHDIDEDICKQFGYDHNCREYELGDDSCIECIVKYFYKKNNIPDKNSID